MKFEAKRSATDGDTVMHGVGIQRVAGLVALAALAVDQLTKWLAEQWLAGGDVAVAPFFNLVLLHNRGISFGLFQSAFTQSGPWLPTVLALGIVAALSVWVRQTRRRIDAVALGSIIGGALGNVVDRVLQGAVTDFLDFHLAGHHWPAFNMADVAVVTGASLLALSSFRGDKQ